MRVIETLGESFQRLIENLAEGNMKKAEALARRERTRLAESSLSLVSQDLIEEMAQAQALKSAFVNSPSIFPGIGTLISFWLLGAENLLILDQGVTLILALWKLHGLPTEDADEVVARIIQVMGEAFHLVAPGQGMDSQHITQAYMTSALPHKYLGRGVNRGVDRLMHRLFPLKRRSRLLPVGIGIVSSALYAYNTTVRIGRLALERIPAGRQGPPRG